MSWFGRTPLAGTRWVVIDCETSGLDLVKDRLLSVAAVEVTQERIVIDRSYSAVVRQEQPSDANNILVHGIGGAAQLAGRPAPEVLHEFIAFLEEGVPVAFHAPFDKAMLDKAFKEAGIRTSRKRWLDLATLAPVLFPDLKSNDLDSWLAAFGIECTARHDALSDAYSTAQLLLVMLEKAKHERVASVEVLIRLASSAGWLPQHR